MFGRIAVQLDGHDRVEVTPTLGDVCAWERETGGNVAQLEATPQLSAVAWIAWHAWRRTAGARALPYVEFERSLVDLEVQDDPAGPTAPGPPAGPGS